MFLDDVGVTVAMITVTLLAVCVVLLKVLIFSDKVNYKFQKHKLNKPLQGTAPTSLRIAL